MYKAYLSFNQLREYLALLIENGLIEYEGDQTYRTTESDRQDYATKLCQCSIDKILHFIDVRGE